MKRMTYVKALMCLLFPSAALVTNKPEMEYLNLCERYWEM